MFHPPPPQLSRAHSALPLSSSQLYASTSQLAPSTHSAPDPATFDFPTGTVKFDCPWCDKCYTGPNGRSVWRRHAQEKHNLPCNARRSRPLTDRTLSLPSHLSSFRQLAEAGQWEDRDRLRTKLRNELDDSTDHADTPIKEITVQHRPKKRRSLGDDKENETSVRTTKKVRRDSVPIFVQPESLVIPTVSFTQSWSATLYNSPYKPHAPLARSNDDHFRQADLKPISSHSSLHPTPSGNDDGTHIHDSSSVATWTAEEREMLSLIVDKVDHKDDPDDTSEQTQDSAAPMEPGNAGTSELESKFQHGVHEVVSSDAAIALPALPITIRDSVEQHSYALPLFPGEIPPEVLSELPTNVMLETKADAKADAHSLFTPQKGSPLRTHPASIFSPSSTYTPDVQVTTSPRFPSFSLSCISPFRLKPVTTTPDKRRLAAELGLAPESSPRGGYYRAQVKSTVAGRWVDDF